MPLSFGLSTSQSVSSKVASANSTTKSKSSSVDFASTLSAEQAAALAGSALVPGASVQNDEPVPVKDEMTLRPEDVGGVYQLGPMGWDFLPSTFIGRNMTPVASLYSQEALAALQQRAFLPFAQGLTPQSALQQVQGFAAQNAAPAAAQTDSQVPMGALVQSLTDHVAQSAALRVPTAEAAGEQTSAKGEQGSDFSGAMPMLGALSGEHRVVVSAEPAAAPAPAAPTPAAQMVDHIQTTLQDGRRECAIQLQPEHLGRLSIKLVMSEGALSARIEVGDPSVRALINGQVNDLRDTLQDRGIRVAELSVVYQSVNQSMNENEPHQPGEDRRHDRPASIRIDRAQSANEGAAPAMPQMGESDEGLVVNA